MAARMDFRRALFDTRRVLAAGRSVGMREYWRLYAIENILRVILHSLLKGKFPAGDWWTNAVDAKIKGKVTRVKKDYASQPNHCLPGPHDVYYIFLKDLIEIMRANAALLVPHIRDLDQWLVRLEHIRLSRNVVGHMNWLKVNDSRRLTRAYNALLRLVDRLERSGVSFEVP